MAGGLLNLIAIGNQNIILTGNPTKSFFKAKYVKYTNFGMQKFRIDPQGSTELLQSRETTFKFNISRFGDLLMDTYLVVKLPQIWSPIFRNTKYNSIDNDYRPYEFQWIKNVGTQLIKEVKYTIGGILIQKHSGSYIQNVIQRDYDNNKKELFDIMIGNVNYLNDPANYSNRNNNYPNAYNYINSDLSNIEPSINDYTLYIPINSWYSLSTTMALPLICLQYANLEIEFTFRPIEDLFTIKDVLYDLSINEQKININNYDEIPRIRASESTDEAYQFYRFIQEPPVSDISSGYNYNNKDTKINSDMHLISTQCFLSEEERTLFANNEQNYLIKVVYEHIEDIKQKSGKFSFDTNGLVSNWMWYLQRDDVKKRNEWSNYTNWPYENKVPNSLIKLTKNLDSENQLIYYPITLSGENYKDDISKNIYITGNVPSDSEQKNHKEILKDFSIICDGKQRENELPSGIYNKVEKYLRTNGCSKEGIYNYNFCLNTDLRTYQPNGAFNTNKFKKIEFEYNLYSNPPLDLSRVLFTTICNPDTGEVIATSKDPGSIYQYNYKFHIFEERYNILRFQSGTAELLYGR